MRLLYWLFSPFHRVAILFAPLGRNEALQTLQTSQQLQRRRILQSRRFDLRLTSTSRRCRDRDPFMLANNAARRTVGAWKLATAAQLAYPTQVARNWALSRLATHSGIWFNRISQQFSTKSPWNERKQLPFIFHGHWGSRLSKDFPRSFRGHELVSDIMP